jgi:tRNA-splicing ligase RtcB
MLYVSFQKVLDFNKSQWLAIGKQIRKKIPMAKNHRVNSIYRDFKYDFPWSLATLQMRVFTDKLNKKFGTDYKGPAYTSEWFFEVCERINCRPIVAVNSIGSLGSGNHFIEFSTSDKTGNTGVTVHAGSRNFGYKVAAYWQKIAKENMIKAYEIAFDEQIKTIKANWPKTQWDERIKKAKKPPATTGLEYLEGQDWYNYLHEMDFAQIYAHENVVSMMEIILTTLNLDPMLLMSKDTIHTVHNYISFEDFIIRKGAVRSILGQKMLIPFNMEDGILVCEGKSNENWYESAPHGAGRVFGRGEIKRNKDIVVEDIRDRMSKKGIYLSVVPKDEVKEAYKDPAFIEKAIAPTATIVDRLRPIITLKAKD